MTSGGEVIGSQSLPSPSREPAKKILYHGSGPRRNITRIMKGAVVQSADGAGMILINFSQGYSTFSEMHVLLCRKSTTLWRRSSSAALYSARRLLHQLHLSSRGHSIHNLGILKPDIMGSGVNVLAEWPFKVGPL
jgi:hypothetical protein